MLSRQRPWSASAIALSGASPEGADCAVAEGKQRMLAEKARSAILPEGLNMENGEVTGLSDPLQ
jgi:hypothetical protein